MRFKKTIDSTVTQQAQASIVTRQGAYIQALNKLLDKKYKGKTNKKTDPAAAFSVVRVRASWVCGPATQDPPTSSFRTHLGTFCIHLCCVIREVEDDEERVLPAETCHF